MPYLYAMELKKNRAEKPDQHEANEEHLRNAEQSFLELAKIYGFKTINCFQDNKVKSIEAIHEEVWGIIRNS